LCGIDFAEGAGEFFLLQLVLNGQHELRELLKIRARMELHLFEPSQVVLTLADPGSSVTVRDADGKVEYLG
jgi:hypothetical protein